MIEMHEGNVMIYGGLRERKYRSHVSVVLSLYRGINCYHPISDDSLLISYVRLFKMSKHKLYLFFSLEMYRMCLM